MFGMQRVWLWIRARNDAIGRDSTRLPVAILCAIAIRAVAIDADGQSGAWTTGASMPGASYGLNAVFLDGKVYAISGFATNRVGIYDIATNSWTTGMPLPDDTGYNLRQYFGTAVVSGKIYVIGGDTGGTGPRDTNYIYDPVADTWSSGASLPSPRWANAAVALNGKIYSIGGYDGTKSLKEVQVYDPANNGAGWTATTDLPQALSGVAAGVIDNKIYIAGGNDGNGNTSTAAYVFDPGNPGAWSPVANMPVRGNGSSVVLNQKLFIIGGAPAPAGGVNDTKVLSYDPANNQWSQNYVAMPTPRHDLGLAGDDASGKIYAVGGYGNGSTKSVLEILSLASLPPIISSQLNLDFLGSTESFDGSTWSVQARMPTARRGFGLVAGSGTQDGTDGRWATGPNMSGNLTYGLSAAFVNGKLYAISGFTFGGDLDTRIYDPSTNVWSLGASLPADVLRQYYGCAVVNGKIYVIGGDTGGSGDRATNFEYNTTTDVWSRKADLPGGARYGCRAVALNGKIYVIGGYQGSTSSQLSRVDIYDPSNDTWSPGIPLPGPRSGALVEVINGKIYIVAGNDASGILTSGYVFDPVAGMYTPIAPIPVLCGSGAATGVLNNILYVIGGGPDPETAVEAYDPVSDTWTTNYPPMPSGRHDLGAAVDPATNRIFAVGGNFHSPNGLSTFEILTIDPPSPRLYAAGGKIAAGCTAPTSTFESYNPVADNWAILQTPLPTARSGLGAAGINDELYFIGGDVAGGEAGCENVVKLNESYSLTTKTWTSRRPMNFARSNPGVAALNGQIYVIGGDDGTGTALDKVERYDPAADAWISLPDLPTPRIAPVVQVLNNVLYVIGGYDSAHRDGLATVESYSPASNNWTLQAPMITPRSLGAAGGTLNNRIYVFGGNNGSKEISTNEIYDPSTGTWSVAPALPTARFGLGGAVLNNKIYAVGGRLQGIAQVGRLFVYQITADNQPTTFGVDPSTPLPDGLQIDPNQGIIFGVPTSPSSDNLVTVIASNSSGTGSANLRFSIESADLAVPAIVSSQSVTATVNQPFGQPGANGTGFQVEAVNVPSPTYSAGGLPPGLQLNPATGLISGIPTTAGNFQVSISVFNTSAKITVNNILQVTVTPCDGGSCPQVPLITSPDNATLVVNKPFSYKITASQSATFDVKGLPPGLSLTGDTIAGVYTGGSSNDSNQRIAERSSISPNTLKIRPPGVCQLVAINSAILASTAKSAVGSGFGGSGGVGTAPLNFISQYKYTIALDALPAADGSVNGAYNADASFTARASANSGYSFLNWTENGQIQSTSQNYTFTPTANRSLVANFVSGPPPPAPTPTQVDGSGAIKAPGGGQATFSIQMGITAKKRGKGKISGSFSYSDPAVPLAISVNKFTNATITGNQASFGGTAKGTGKKTKKISFTVNVTDNGIPGTNDTFSISAGTYSASGNLTSGDILIH